MSDLEVTPADLDLLRDVLADSGYRYVHRKRRNGEDGWRGSSPGHAERFRTETCDTPTGAAKELVSRLRELYGDRWFWCLPAGPGKPVPPPPPRRVPPPDPAPEEPAVAANKSPDPTPAPPPVPRPGDPCVLFQILTVARRADDPLLAQWAAAWLAESGYRVTFDGGPGA